MSLGFRIQSLGLRVGLEGEGTSRRSTGEGANFMFIGIKVSLLRLKIIGVHRGVVSMVVFPKRIPARLSQPAGVVWKTPPLFHDSPTRL